MMRKPVTILVLGICTSCSSPKHTAPIDNDTSYTKAPDSNLRHPKRPKKAKLFEATGVYKEYSESNRTSVITIVTDEGRTRSFDVYAPAYIKGKELDWSNHQPPGLKPGLSRILLKYWIERIYPPDIDSVTDEIVVLNP